MSGVNRQFDDPEAYDDAESFDGNGWLPPDWRARRAAVRNRQGGQCATCGRTPAEDLVVTHVRDLSDGGDHRLQNLVGQCPACAKREEFVTEKRVPSAESNWKHKHLPSPEYSTPVLVGTLVVMGVMYVAALHSNAGSGAPAGLIAYVPWLIGQQVQSFVQFIQPLVNFIGIVIFIIILAYALGTY